MSTILSLKMAAIYLKANNLPFSQGAARLYSEASTVRAIFQLPPI
jgi:hypothetical protein